MQLSTIKAALAAAQEFKRSENRLEALKSWTNCKALATNQSSDSAVIDDDILETIVGQLNRSAERFHRVLSSEQSTENIRHEIVVLQSNIKSLLNITRRLNGGILPCDALYEMETVI